MVLEGAIVPIGYSVLMPLVIYTIKGQIDVWHSQKVTVARVWLLIEITFFFAWLKSIVIFMWILYWGRLKSMTHQEDELLEDENVWNDKNTDDILNFMKVECFLMCYQSCFIILEIIIGFTNMHGFQQFGAVEWMPNRVIFLTLISGRVSDFILTLIMMHRGQNQYHQDNRRINILSLVIRAIFLTVALYLFYGPYGPEERHNVAHHMWI